MTKKMNRVLSMLMVILMLVSMLPTNVLAETGTGTSPEISILMAGSKVALPGESSTSGNLFSGSPSYVTDKEVRPNATEGDQVWKATGTLEFHIPASALLVQEGSVSKLKTQWQFDLKSDLGIEEWADLGTSGVVNDTAGNKCGTFSVQGTTFKLHFDPDYTYKQVENGKGIEGNLMVKGYWDKDGNKNENSITITLGDDTYTIYPHGKGNVWVKKWVDYSHTYTLSNKTVVWKIEVGSDHGTNGPIYLTDTLDWGLQATKVEVQTAGSSSKQSVGFTQNGKVVTLNQPLPALPYNNGNVGRHYVYITTTVARELNKSQGNAGETHTAAINKKNDVAVRSTNYANEPINGQPATASFYDNQYMVYKWAGHKWDQPVTIDANNRIWWTIRVNESRANIAGMTLVDDKLASAVQGTLSIEPDSGYTRNGNTISFTGGTNTNEYFICYQTAATLVHNTSNNTYSSDTNSVVLKNGNDVVSQDSAEQKYEYNRAGYITKTSTYDSQNRKVNYTITVNPDKKDLTGFTGLDDYFQIKIGDTTTTYDPDQLPSGFAIVPGSIKVNDQTQSSNSVNAALQALSNTIKADVRNNQPNKTYTLTYSVSVPMYESGNIKNFGQVAFGGNITVEGDDGGKDFWGVPVVQKSGESIENGRYKWTLIINPNRTTMNGWTINDEIRWNSALVGEQKVYFNDSSTPSHTYSYTNIDHLETALNGLMTSGNNKITVVYYSTIEEIGDIWNKATVTVNGQGKDAWAKNGIGFTHSITKTGTGVENIDEGWKLKWKVEYPLPSEALPDEKAILTDNFNDGQHMTGADKTEFEANVRAAFPAGTNLEFGYTGSGDNITGFVITITGIPKSTGSNVVFNFCTRDSAQVASITYANTITEEVVGHGSNNSTGYNQATSKFGITKNFVGPTTTIDGKTYGYGDQLKWEIRMVIPKGAEGRAISIWDNLQESNQVVMTRAQVYVGGELKYDQESYNGNGQFQEITNDYVQFRNEGSHSKNVVLQAGHPYKAGDEIRIILSGRVKDPTQVQTVENQADARIYYKGDGDFIQDSDTASISVTYPQKDVVVSKSGRLTGENDDMQNVIKYSVVINEKAETLLSENAELRAVDTLTWSGNGGVTADNFELLADTVKLYYRNADGSKGAQVSGWAWTHNVVNNSHVINLTKLPDGAALIFEYDYKLVSTWEFRGVTLTNHFQFNGYETGSGSDSTVTEVKYMQAAVVVKSPDVTFYKYADGNQNVRLEGVNFKLYKRNGNGWDWVADGRSNEKGVVVFTPEVTQYETNKAYKLEEQANPGYEIAKPYVFSFGDDKGYQGEVVRAKGLSYWIENNTIKTEATIQKVWTDADNQDGLRPASLTVRLMNGTTKVKEAVLSENNNWKYTATDLRKLDANGNEITYTWEEVTTDADGKQLDWVKYYVSGSSKSGTVTTLTNTHVPVKIEASVKKVWEDANDQDGHRPDSLTVTLSNGTENVGTVTLSESNNWTDKIENLPKYANGTEITYTWTEDTTGLTWQNGDETVGYTQETPVITNVTNDVGTVIGTLTTLTNSYTPETIQISGSKIWVDGNNAENTRPETITIRLWAKIDGEDAVEVTKDASGNDIAPMVVATQNGGSWKFENLPKYKNGGTPITYTITEDPLYKENCSEPLYHTVVNGYNVTNTLLTEVEGEKRWIDDGSAARPAITITLCGADGKTPVTVDAAGKQIVNPVTVTAKDQWAWSFTYLPAYTANGTEIKYTIKEDAVDGYSTEVTGYNVTNTQLTEIPVTKEWDDNDDQDGVRPEYIQVTLHRFYTDNEGGTVEEIVETKKIYENNIVNELNVTWGWTFTDLPKYYDKGKPYKYWVTEDTVGSYESSITGPDANGNLVTITNCHEPETTSVSVTKEWVDGNNAAGKRPTSITINLMAKIGDGAVEPATDNQGNAIAALTLNEANSWTGTFENLPKYKAGGKLVTYTITEGVLSDYNEGEEGVIIPVETAVTDSEDQPAFAFKVTNTLTQEYVKLKGEKTWEHNGFDKAYAVPTIVIQLFRDNETDPIAYKELEGVTLENVDQKIAYAFENLPKYAVPCAELAAYDPTKLDGHIFVYTVKEVMDSKYAVAFDCGEAERDEESEEENELIYNFTNTLKVKEIKGAKTWVYPGYDATLYPEITIKLTAEGKNWEYTQTLPDAEGKLEYSFKNLPIYDEAGNEIEYTVVEILPDYCVNADGTDKAYTSSKTEVETGKDNLNIFNFTNELKTIDISGEKTWDGIIDGVPVVKAQLLRDGIVIAEQVLDLETKEYSFVNLPEYAVPCDALQNYTLGYDGHKFTYAVQEVIIINEDEDGSFGYESEGVAGEANDSNGLNFTNDLVRTEITGEKEWIDNENDVIHSDIIIELYRDRTEDSEPIAVQVLSHGTTEYTFTGMPKYAVANFMDYTGEDGVEYAGYAGDIDGHEFVYTVDEVLPEGYEPGYTKTLDEAELNITNELEVVEVVGEKTWVDKGNEDQRPETIKINLLRDGKQYKHVVVAINEKDGSYDYSFTDLPKHAVPGLVDGKDGWTLDGHEFVYTVTEDAVTDYDTAIDGYNVKNTISQKYVRVSGTKTWVDPEGTWHNPITINLLRDGVKIAKIVLENGEETYAFRNLPKYAVPCAELKDYKGELDGHTFRYSVTEDLVPGYTSVQNGTNFTNTIEQEWIPVNVTKIWADKGATGVEHPAITVRLHRDGVEIDSVVLENGDTYHSFTNLPRYDLVTGQRYVYTVTEDPVEGYTTRINGYTIINTTEGPEMVTISGTKTWDDDGREHDNATEVKIQLTRSIEGGAAEVVTDAEIVWNGNVYAFYNLLKADENGNEYTYSIEEQPVDGYDAFYEGYNIINRLRYDVIEVGVSGTKYWNDGNDANKIRPEEITVMLLRDGKVIETATVDAQNGWNYSFDKLPDNDGYGHYYTYTVTEQLVPGYWLMVDGNDLYNTPQEVERFRFRKFREEELEELLEIFDYGVPLWGGLLGTGDEVPAYPFVFGGAGLIALVAYLMVNRKRKKA